MSKQYEIINDKIDALCQKIAEKYEMKFYEWDSDVVEVRERVAKEIIEEIKKLKLVKDLEK